MTGPASSGKDSSSGRFRLTIPQMLWLVALCALACGFVVRATQTSRRRSPDQLAFSTDGRLLAANFNRGGVLVWDVSDAPPRIVGVSEDVDGGWLYRPTEWVDHFHFADATRLVKIGDDSIGRWRLVLWDVMGDEPATDIRLTSYPYGVALSPDGRLAAVTDSINGRVDVIDVATGRLVHSVPTALTAEGVAFSEDGEELLAVKQGELEVFQVDGWARVRTMEIPEYSFVDFSPDGRYLAISNGSIDNYQFTVRVLDTEDETDADVVHIGIDEDWSFFPNSDQLAVWSDSRARIFDIPSGKQVLEFELPESDVEVNAVTVSPDGRTLAIAERDRVLLWDMRSGEQIAVLWSRNAFLEGLLFSAGFFVWAVVWGLMRRRRPRGDAPQPAAETVEEVERPKPKTITVQLTLARLVVLAVVGGGVMALLAVWGVTRFAEFEGPSGVLMIALAVLSGPVLLFLLVFALLFVKRQILHVHGAELQRATGIARFPGRTARFGNVSAYFFGAPRLEAHFGEDLATARRRLESLLGKVAEAPHVPAFCFATQDEFDAYVGRQAPLSAVYSPTWWSRQLFLCERPGHAIADPREMLRALFGYLLLWNHKGFRTPYWLTSVVNAYVAHGDDTAHLAEVHRRLAAQLEREDDITPLPHQLDDKQYVKLVMKRNDREPFRTTLLYSDVCTALAEYLLGNGDRRRRFCDFLQGLKRHGGVEEALRREYGCGVEQLFQEWLAWFRAGLADGSLDTSTYEDPTESVRRQILQDVIPLLSNADADLESRCRAARNLAGRSLLGAEALIDALDDGPDELRHDARWSLEAIAGKRLADNPALCRSWLVEVAPTASPPTEDASDSPLEAEVLERVPEAGGLSQDQPSPAQGSDRLAEEVSVSMAQPIVTPPKSLSTCWNLMTLGGFVAILLPSVLLFETGMTWWPLFYYGVAMGIFAVARGVGRHTRWLRAVALLQVAGALACDPINPVLGVVELGLSRTKRAREYLEAHK